MSQKPIHRVRPDESRESIWAIIRRLKTLTAKDIFNETHLGLDTIGDYLIGLTNAGYLERTEGVKVRNFAPHVYHLVKDCGIDAPKVRKDGTEVDQGKGRLQMWNTMSVLKSFTPKDLAFNAGTDQIVIAEAEAKHYVRYLHAAGYLTLVSPAKAGSQQARYRLIPAKWSGPKPPQIQRVRQVYDPNVKKVVWTGGEE